MTQVEFLAKWVGRIMVQLEDWPEYQDDIARLLNDERSRERRRMCTDQTYYSAALSQTMREIVRHEI